MLNRDTWSDDVVQNLVASGFVFWQNYWASEHGKKFCSLYQIDRDSLPVVVIIDPRTGEIRQRWTGFLEPQDMTEKRMVVVFVVKTKQIVADLCPFVLLAGSVRLLLYAHAGRPADRTEEGIVNTCQNCNRVSANESLALLLRSVQEAEPNIMDASEDDQLAAAIAASMQDNNGGSDDDEPKQAEEDMDQEEKDEEEAQEAVVALTPEPDAGAPGVTRVQIRVPDGSRLTRRFLKTDPLAMVWTFVKDQVPEARGRAFELRTAFPPSAVAYNDTLSIEEGKLENASLMVKWL
ncbi:hypothetical protein ON010_g12019 [Phytophthora cinnamomi]|nr:hypothetical protein ON010_g12019 [Phytophthora cinnamomi]